MSPAKMSRSRTMIGARRATGALEVGIGRSWRPEEQPKRACAASAASADASGAACDNPLENGRGGERTRETHDGPAAGGDPPASAAEAQEYGENPCRRSAAAVGGEGFDQRVERHRRLPLRRVAGGVNPLHRAPP